MTCALSANEIPLSATNTPTKNLAGYLKTLPPNGPFPSNSFFGHKPKVAIIKTNCATIAFFFLSSFPSPRSFFFSFPFPLLLWFWSFSRLRILPFDAFSLKWLQISIGWASKNRLDIYSYFEQGCGKNVHATVRKVIWDMFNTLFLSL